MFDSISAHQLEDTTEVGIYWPNGQPATIPAPGEDSDGKPNTEQLTVTVRRMSSSTVQRFINGRKNQHITGMKQQKRAGREISVTAESIEDDAIALLVFTVVAWSGFTANEKPVPCTPENVLKLLSNRAYVWIRDQIDVAVGDDTLYDLGNS